jgi:hypothetical protein
MQNIEQAGYTAEGFDQETIDERIEALLEQWGVETDPDLNADLPFDRDRAYQLAVSFPTEIQTDLFIELVTQHGWRA